ncbi:DeoR/GlpR family DNA-binding transcription regulator [Paenibacillus cremeus]|uniref:DeoR/GlpR transcriptional regulator n=1 Tax=Paenibacillus cremeus TaxID=2163881 RepID=A0A559K5F9_9BACL|nr:DeoR/GlpR family DNA-binding transcription regulator [Paenibacillus cremeus]TVY07333.1 DeoR/GlpR transcriptional regulator [Paenibacillus cremeus]
MEERHSEIISLLQQQTMLGIQELCDLLHVSPATVRRDLTKMEDLGLIKRMHGGAILHHSVDAGKPEPVRGGDPYLLQKLAIVEAACGMVQPGDTIFIDAGSTTELLAERLTSIQPISIITNSIKIAYQMFAARGGGSSVFVCGGTFSESDPQASIVGPLAEQMISQFRANICFVGTSAIDCKHGVTDPNLLIARMKEKMISHSSKVVLIVDHSKFGKVKQAFVCPLEHIHCVITDDLTTEEDVKHLRSLGVEVKVVNVGVEV